MRVVGQSGGGSGGGDRARKSEVVEARGKER